MKYFSKKKWLIIFIILFFCLASFLCYHFIFFKNSSFNNSTSLPPISTINASDSLNVIIPSEQVNFPVRLKIPSIRVDAVIESVSITSDGAMDTPKNSQNVAWFNLGTLPGSIGSAVIAGHFDNKDGQDAVFHELNKLRQNDELFIEDEQGKIIIFIVQEIRTYDSEAYTPEVFSSDDGKHLNLITCIGNWDKSKKSYSKRLVVFASIK